MTGNRGWQHAGLGELLRARSYLEATVQFRRLAANISA